MSTTLVIGDPHTTPDDPDVERFDLLGEFIVKHRPDNIVQLGDFLTYDSISAWNRSKRLSMEGKRLGLEMQAATDAYDRMMDPMRRLNNTLRTSKRAQYSPRLVWIEGNHEDRAQRYAELNPEIADVVEYRNYFNPEEEGWTVVPYRHHASLHGVLFTHIPMSGNNQPISSKHLTKNVIKDYASSVVFGHTHQLAYECDGIRTLQGGDRVSALNAGCFFEYVPEYAVGSRAVYNWWAGLILLKHKDNNGDYDFETFSLDSLRRGE